MSQPFTVGATDPWDVAAAVLRTGYHAEPASTMNGVMVLCLHGELDMATAPQANAALHAALDARPPALIVDVAGLSFIDSTGIGALVGVARRAESDGCSLTLRSPSRPVLKVLQLTGVERLVALEPGPATD